ncbi:helix-turn-helix domain-containing protein [Pseudoruminococcus massiliensis]|uniref:helix-turn-helix domain-containing protein n=1 Tax=Pseudoruminococcus massiliensis TaxID=2086583 RepID=UPI002067E3F3|nr:MAG TPA: helix-turn-helix domain protein [Caudoviricetes sp.]
MAIGENLKKIRTEAGITQATLADKVGIGRSMLAQIERGTKALSLPLAETIATELGCDIYDFLDKKGA